VELIDRWQRRTAASECEVTAVWTVPLSIGAYLVLYAITARSKRGLDPRNTFHKFNSDHGALIMRIGLALVALGVIMGIATFLATT